MNPREICRQPEYEIAILTTYNFDPIFFEKIVLPELWQSRIGEVLVIADFGQVEQRVQSWSDRLNYLGKGYILDTAKTRGYFHPKTILKIGKAGAHLVCGSGNLTSGGWGVNNEIAANWSILPGNRSGEQNVRFLLENLRLYVSSNKSKEIISKALTLPWINTVSTAPIERQRCFYTPPTESLSSILARRWKGRKFNKLILTTGSTDQEGSFLRWCHDQFGISECTIVMTPSTCQFDDRKLKKLPLQVFMSQAPANKLMHAKFYMFETARDVAVVMGSANCSAAAWLNPPASSGNVEAICVYDNLSKENISFLASLPTERFYLKDFLKDVKVQPLEHRHNASSTNILESIQWTQYSGILIVLFSEGIPIGALVTIRIGVITINLRSEDPFRCKWIGEISQIFQKPFSEIAEVEVEYPNHRRLHMTRWIDHLEELDHSSKGKRIVTVIQDLASASTYNERRLLINELIKIQHVLLNDTEFFQDPPLRKPADDQTKSRDYKDGASEPINPEDLLRSIYDIGQSRGQLYIPNIASHMPGLVGIIRAIFESREDPSDQETDEQEEKNGESDDTPKGVKQRVSNDGASEDARFRRLCEKLETQIDDFLDKLREPAFGQRCTVTQLIQAAAYPIAVGIAGITGKWFSRQKANEWIVSVADALFMMEVDDSHDETLHGLLHLVRLRYAEQKREQDFVQIIGDGVLWIVLLAGAAIRSNEEEWECLIKALLVKSIYQRKDLISSSDSNRLAQLVLYSRFRTMRDWFTKHAAHVIKELDCIESKIIEILDTNNRMDSFFKRNEIVFHSFMGWGRFIKREKVNGNDRITFYMQLRAREIPFGNTACFISLNRAKECMPSIQAHLEKIKHLFQATNDL